MSRTHYWLVEYRVLGGHVHIILRCGPQPHSRAKAGDLTVEVAEWEQGLSLALASLPNVEFREFRELEP